MNKWNNTPEKERERYVNQDVITRNWREVLSAEIGPGFYDAMADRCGIQDLDAFDSYFPETSPLSKIVDPVELECLRLFYVERMTRQEIAESIVIQHVIDGRVITTRPFTVYIVQKKLEAGRRAIKNAMGDDWRQFLKKNKTNKAVN